jgi:zinc and cadmium transporter
MLVSPASFCRGTAVVSPLPWIIAGSLAGGAVSVLLAATFAYTVLSAWVPRMVGYAVGVLLGVVFLDLLPEAFERSTEPHAMFGVVLFGILAFFLLEKAALWRHSHAHGGHVLEEAGGVRRKPSGLLILVGDAFHNFVDGVLIAAAFLADFWLGVATSLAVMVHEIPQELGDFAVLLDAGYSKARALWLNLGVSFASLAGGVFGYLVLEYAQPLVEYALALAAACFIYIAIADLIPQLHQHDRGREAWPQIGFINWLMH